MVIGITQVAVRQTTLAGSHPRPSTIRALPAGGYQTVEAAEYGLQHSAQAVIGQNHPIGIQRIRAWTSPIQTRN